MSGRRQHLCASGAIEECGKGLRFALQSGDRLIPAFAIRFQGKVYAYQNRCAHMAVELDWQHGQFFDNDRQYLVCSTHGALYHPDTGTCAYGRCDGRSLISVDVEESDGRVSVISENGIHLTNDNQQITPET